jgi:hypothetical protein
VRKILDALGDPNTSTVRGLRAVCFGLSAALTAVAANAGAVQPRLALVCICAAGALAAFAGAIGAGEKNEPKP